MMDNKNSFIKPYLKWAGGKRQLLSEIKKHLPKDIDHYTYYEPFIGAGAVFFNLQPQKAVINDFNEQLILTYIAIKNDLMNLVKLLSYHKENISEEYYYELRDIDRDAEKFNNLTNTEKAARLIFLNKTCYNGLYRVNSKGFFNVPYGKHKNPAVYDEKILTHISDYLNSNKIKILNMDFEEAVCTTCKDSFIYFDPPYHSPQKNNFTDYHKNGFNETDQKRLRDLLIKMTEKNIKCLLSNSDTEYIRKLYQSDYFNIIPVKAKRLINSVHDARGKVDEVLIKNWKD